MPKGGDPRQTEIAFFGGSFTAVDTALQRALLEAAEKAVKKYGFAGIRFSTRPDAVGEEELSLLSRYPITTVELGVQSMREEVLAQNRRGHTVEDVEKGVNRLKKAGYQIILQMMTGLAGDDDEGAIKTAEKLAAFHPQGVRIYPTLVLQHTPLAKLWEKGLYQPQTLEQAVSLCANLLDFFEKRNIPVIRLGLHASEDIKNGLLAGPYHPAFRELCISRVFYQKVLAALSAYPVGSRIAVTVHSSCRSQFAGQKKENLMKWKKMGYDVFLEVSEDIFTRYFEIK